MSMFRNFIKIAFRSLLKQKVYSAINIVGLAVSITSCLLIVLYVKNELSYDKFNTKADNIYKMVLERKYPDRSTLFSPIPHSFADVARTDIPEIQNTLRLGGPFNNTLVTYRVNDSEIRSFEEDNILLADTAFFSFFDIKLLKGDKKTALTGANQMVITEATAKKYFGNTDPIGKTLGGDLGEFKITGVCENVPDNSHLKFDFLASWITFPFNRLDNYITFDSHTYLELKPGTDPSRVESKFPKLVDTYAAGDVEKQLGHSWEDYKKAGNGYRYFLQPLTSIHFDPLNIEGTIRPSGNRSYVYILAFIAVLILVIACINFMNLATARSAERAREVGVRKVMGSLKNHLVIQFLTESILIALIATAFALLSIQFVMPYFNDLIEKQLHLVFTPDVIIGLLGFAVFVGIMAGIYPAFVLSGYSPVLIMKGNFSANAKGTWLRNGLVVFQFMISIVLIVGAIVVSDQMQFLQSKKLGYDKEQVVMVERAFALNDKATLFIEELKRIPEVQSAAGVSSMLGSARDFFGIQLQPDGSTAVLTAKGMIMDDEFSETIGFELASGRNFSKETVDSLSIVLNEQAVKTFGLKDPLGSKLKQHNRNPDGTSTVREFVVIGVVKDFHFQSLRDEITPLVIQSSELFRNIPGYVAVRVKQGSTLQAISKIEMKWKEILPAQSFRYSFLNERMKQEYIEEQRSGKLFTVFSGLAIIIACVGLFGLSAYTASLRTKEIGVRKVLGSTVGDVVILLSKDFTKLVLIAFVLAVPLGWWMMDQWLSNFAYRIDLSLMSFLLAGILALLIALITVSYQSIKAAMVNPIKSLKSE
jgi:putative ABC transport system permease protein